MSSDGDGTRQIKGVDTNPRGRKPMPLGRAEVAGSRSETILESERPNGTPIHGINPANVHTSARDQHYAHPEQQAHRRSLGAMPYSGKR